MYTMSTIANTAKCMEIRNLNKVEGGEPKYCINFSIASNRPYTKTVKNENGEEVKERISDFMSCTAYGKTAELVNKYINLKDAEGKFISRRVYLKGRLEKFKVERVIETEEIIEIPSEKIVDGKVVKVNKKCKVTTKTPISYESCKFIVEYVEFLDATPENATIKNNKNVSRTIEILDESVDETNDNSVDETNDNSIDEKENLMNEMEQCIKSGDFDKAEEIKEQLDKIDNNDLEDQNSNADEEFNGDVSLDY